MDGVVAGTDEGASRPFMTYLRALHETDTSHKPDDEAFKDLEVLKMHTGNIMIVYNSYPNGWSDGVCLNSMVRGWIPTNHCEPYMHDQIKDVFSTMSNAWKAVADGSFNWELEAKMCTDALTSGVRLAMTRTDCMRRGSPMIDAYPLLKLTRKTMFSRLSETLTYVEEVSRQNIPADDFNSWDECYRTYIGYTAEIAVKLVGFMDLWLQKATPALVKPVVESNHDRLQSHPSARRQSVESSLYSVTTTAQDKYDSPLKLTKSVSSTLMLAPVTPVSRTITSSMLIPASNISRVYPSSALTSWLRDSPDSPMSQVDVEHPVAAGINIATPSPSRQDFDKGLSIARVEAIKGELERSQWSSSTDLTLWRDSDSSFGSRDTVLTTPDRIYQIGSGKGRILRVEFSDGQIADFAVPKDFGNVDALQFAQELVRDEDGKLVAASADNLVLALIYEPSGMSNEGFLITFLTFFRRFMKPAAVMTIFIEQYKKPMAQAGMTADIRRRIVHVLEEWLTKYWDSEHDTEILVALNDMVRNADVPMTEHARRLLMRAMSKEAYIYGHDPVSPCTGLDYLQVFSGRYSPASLASRASDPHKPLKLLDISIITLAEQFTILTSSLFHLVSRFDLIRCVADRADKSNSVVRAMSTLSSDIANLVIHTIVTVDSLQRRQEVLTHWIMIGTSLILMQDYESVMAVASGINSTPVLRLHRTWAGLGEDMLGLFEKLKTVTSTHHNFGTLRSFLKEKAVTGPCVPFLGLILADLTYAGNAPGKCPDGKINWRKYTQLHAVKAIVNEMQQRPYNLPVAQNVQEWLCGELRAMHSLAQSHPGEGMADRMHQLSEAIEPRMPPPPPESVVDDDASLHSGGRNLLKKMKSAPSIDQSSVDKGRRRQLLDKLRHKTDKKQSA